MYKRQGSRHSKKRYLYNRRNNDLFILYCGNISFKNRKKRDHHDFLEAQFF